MRHTLLLAVADDFSRRELFRELEGKGLFVVEAASPSQTVERICCFYPDIILLDLKTPKDNFDVCRKISRVCDRPIIAAVPDLDEETKAKGHEAGIQYLIVKPINMEELIAIIKRLARRNQLCSD